MQIKKNSKSLGPISVVLLFCWALQTGFAGAQFLPRLKPIAPRGRRTTLNTSTLNSSPSPWQPLKNQPTFLINGASNPLLLTDGTVVIQDYGTRDWWRLTPDDKGSYVNGTWTQVASLPAGYAPLDYSSAVLADGRVIIEGGEYNFLKFAETSLGAIYDPLANTWKSVSPPHFFAGFGSFKRTIGDAQSVVLPDRTYMQADCCTKQAAVLDSETLTWTPTGTGKSDINSEEGWNLLPDGTVLTVDAADVPNSERYFPEAGIWMSAGSTMVPLSDVGHSYEIGPAVLRPNGTVFYTGACPSDYPNKQGTGTCIAPAHTAIYTPPSWLRGEGIWTTGPDFPDGLDIADGPASILPNGNVLMMTSPGIYDVGAVFFEFDGHDLKRVPGTPSAPNDSSYYGNMLVLPTGQVMLTNTYYDIEIYTARGGYDPAWAPRIDDSPLFVERGRTYTISGKQFNGVSTGATYGDDEQMNTNYPLVRVTSLFTHHVAYWRTHDHSTMGVATGDQPVSTHFDVPKNVKPDIALLEVVANGISSSPRIVLIY